MKLHKGRCTAFMLTLPNALDTQSWYLDESSAQKHPLMSRLHVAGMMQTDTALIRCHSVGS